MTFLRQERRDSILILTMSDPETLNALSKPSQFEEFSSVCRDSNADDGVKVVIITGEGRGFCSGGNVKDILGRREYLSGGPGELAESYRRTLQQVARAVHGLEMPTIAAVNGPAIGAGMDLACMCDLRIASTAARFSEAFARIGLISGIGGTWFLQQTLSYAQAAELTFSARIFSAEDALAYGLVSKVVEGERLMDETISLAESFALHSGPALRLSKRLLRMSRHSPLQDVLDASASAQAIAQHTDEHRDAMERFFSMRNGMRTGKES